jgi:hypothetical protein
LAAALFAQTDRGTITGTVLDPASAVVPGAKVIARNTETGTVSETVATDTGNYTLVSLPAGNYEVIAESSGFKKTTRPGIQVQVAQTVRVDFALQVGSANESVTVTAEAPLLRTENAEQSVTITGERINSLPMTIGGGGSGPNGAVRNWLGFLTLAPGVSGTAYSAPVNGQPGGAFKILLEGQDVTSSNDTTWTSIVASASVESIGEFSLQTSNFSAEYGQVVGGLFNFTTKSGTNQLHGSAYEYLTNEALDAYRPFTHQRGVDRRHDYGFSLGGPVWLPKLYNGKNKTFFFFNLERYQIVTGASGTLSTVPTSAYRNGDYSAALTGKTLGTDGLGRAIPENGIYDPHSDFASNGQTYRNLFPNNVIPKSQLDPVALKIQDLIPAATNSGLINNWAPNVGGFKYQLIPSVKIDHSFNDTTKLNGYWSVQRTSSQASADGLPFPISGVRVQQVYGHTVRVNLDKSFTPRLLVHLGAGYLRFHNPDSSPPEVLQYDAVKNLGLVGSATDPAGFPLIGSTTQGSFGGFGQMGPNTAGLYYNDKLTAVSSAVYVRENHTFKIGGEFKQEVWTDGNFYQAQGNYNFSGAMTALPAQNTTSVGGGNMGFPYASFLLGEVSSATVAAPKTLQWRKKGWGLYLQDNWKLTRKLTLDYGVRWDLAGMGHELHWRTSEIGIHTPNPSAGGLPGGISYEGYGAGRCNCTFTHTYPYAIGPRLALAYQIDNKTVLRAGWGLSYSAGANWWYVTGGSSSLGVGFNSISFSNAAFGIPALQFANGLKYNQADLHTATLDPGIVPNPPSSLGVPAAWGGQINDPNGGRPARVNQWNIALQREVVRDLSIEAAYVGNRGAWLEANSLVSQNAITPVTFKAYHIDVANADDRTLLTSRIDSPLAAQRGITKPFAAFPNSGTVAQALRPFPEYNDGLAERWAPLGDSWYDALQVKVNKRTSHGLELTTSFSWQKEQALGTGGNPGPGGGGINDVFNRPNQKSLQSTSTPLLLVVAFNYQTPKLTSNKLVRQVAGGWTFGGVLRYGSGALIGVPAARNNLGSYTLQGSTRMNRVAGQPLFTKDPNCGCIDPNKDLVLNPAAWSDAPAGQWGYSSAFYNDYRWQRQASENLNMGRRFQVREKMYLEIRAEFFNAFNRLGLTAPSSGNPTQTTTFSNGVPTGGYGYINANGIAGQRNGQLVARFQF